MESLEGWRTMSRRHRLRVRLVLFGVFSLVVSSCGEESSRTVIILENASRAEVREVEVEAGAVSLHLKALPAGLWQDQIALSSLPPRITVSWSDSLGRVHHASVPTTPTMKGSCIHLRFREGGGVTAEE